VLLPDESIFIVATAHGDIEVLGTEFNVKTTSDQVAVDVKKGLVELKTKFDKGRVKKGIKAVYKGGERAVQKIKI
jgi:ferric-dicitrate binding protein FerR (iron transport regulator)